MWKRLLLLEARVGRCKVTQVSNIKHTLAHQTIEPTALLNHTEIIALV